MQESTPLYGPPPALLSMLECRAVPEFFCGLAAMPLLNYAPRGDGHPVVVVPGFLADSASTWVMRRLLMRLGYETHDWGQGRNTGKLGQAEKQLLDVLRQLRRRTGKRASLIGWSLGGLYARVLAHHEPRYVRSVITLGSPLRFPHRSAADPIYARVTGQAEPPEYVHGIARPPPVPATSIYSAMDGIVAWRCCLSDESPETENIRVHCSHMGLAHHPRVLWIVADRLAQPEGEWRAYAAGRQRRSESDRAGRAI